MTQSTEDEKQRDGASPALPARAERTSGLRAIFRELRSRPLVRAPLRALESSWQRPSFRRAAWCGAVAVAVVLIGASVGMVAARRAILKRAEASGFVATGACDTHLALGGVSLRECTFTRKEPFPVVVDVEELVVRVGLTLAPRRVSGQLRFVDVEQSGDGAESTEGRGHRREIDLDLRVASVLLRRPAEGLALEAKEVSLERGEGALAGSAGTLRLSLPGLQVSAEKVRGRKAERFEVTATAASARIDRGSPPGIDGRRVDAGPRGDDDGVGAALPEGTADSTASTDGEAPSDRREPAGQPDGKRIGKGAAPTHRALRGADTRTGGKPSPPLEPTRTAAAGPLPSKDTKPAALLGVLPKVEQRLAAARERIGAAFPPAVLAHVDALSLAVQVGTDEIRLAPGRLEVTRNGGPLDVTFETIADVSGPPLRGQLVVPFDEQDIVADLSGGPVPLTLGAADPSGVKPSLQGEVHVRLSTVKHTFDSEGSLTVRELALAHPALATEPLRHLAADLRFDVRVEGGSSVELRETELALGALRLRARGRVDDDGRAMRIQLTGELPIAACDALLASMPAGLFPTLQGARLDGTLAASTRFYVDTQNLDELLLNLAVDDRCRFRDVPLALDADRFRQPFRHRAYHPDGTSFERETGPGTASWTPLAAISPYMIVAVLTTEDGGFYHHQGFNRRAMRDALVANLRAGRFVRGASTISMQLAKNLFLGREKTLSRKLEEIVLTDYLEQVFEKDELLELYLNVIEFGPDLYGITAAAEHYFGRTPNELSAAESMFLATLLPSPVRLHGMYTRGAVSEGALRHVHALLRIAAKRGLLSPGELAEALSDGLELHKEGAPPPRPRAPAAPQRRRGSFDDEWQELPTEGP